MRQVSSPFELITSDPQKILNYELKARMMLLVRDLIETNEWTQAESAEKLGVTQPRVSNLINGQIDKFSIEMLIRMIGKLGITFEFNYISAKGEE